MRRSDLAVRSRRVLALVSEAFGGEGGIAQFNRNLLEALAAHEALRVQALGLHASTPCGAPAPARLGWAVPRPGSKLGFLAASVLAVARLRPTVILSGIVGFGPLALPLARAVRARLWTTSHGVEIWQPGPWWDNAGLRGSHLVTTVSRYSRSRLLEWSGLPPGRVEVLPNTVDLERWRPGARPAELVERYAVAGRRVLLTVSRLSASERYKGHDRVLPLLPELNQRLGPVHYVIAGRGDDQPRLLRLAQEVGAQPYVTFAGFVPDAELAAHYRLADAFVMPSTGEGFGIVFLEAMACGCPVVAGNRDGSTDALADGALGRLVDPDSPQELRDAIVDTLRAGRSWDRPIAGVERFALPRFRERVAQLVPRVLGDGPAATGAAAS